MRQRLVFVQAIGKAVAVDQPFAQRVAMPQGCGGDAGDIAAHDHFDRKGLGFNDDGGVGIGQ